METKEDLIADTKKYFEQIIDLCTLILEAEDFKTTSVLTLRDLAESRLSKAGLP